MISSDLRNYYMFEVYYTHYNVYGKITQIKQIKYSDEEPC